MPRAARRRVTPHCGAFSTLVLRQVWSMFERAILAAIASGAVGAPSTTPTIRRETAPTSIVSMIPAPGSFHVPLALAVAAGCLNCRDTSVTRPPSPDRVVAIAVAPPVADLGPGETQQFVARSVTAAGDTVPAATVEWQATGGTITPDGVYTAGSDVGAFSVTASRVGALPGRAGVHVFQRVVAMIQVQPDTATLPIQGSWPLHAVALDSAGDSLLTASITWLSTNPAVAMVDTNGLVTA